MLLTSNQHARNRRGARSAALALVTHMGVWLVRLVLSLLVLPLAVLRPDAAAFAASGAAPFVAAELFVAAARAVLEMFLRFSADFGASTAGCRRVVARSTWAARVRVGAAGAEERVRPASLLRRHLRLLLRAL